MKSRTKAAKRARKMREFKRYRGVCIWSGCARDAIYERTMCAKHLEHNRKKAAAYYKRKVANVAR
jgi:hypothetical protein